MRLGVKVTAGRLMCSSKASRANTRCDILILLGLSRRRGATSAREWIIVVDLCNNGTTRGNIWIYIYNVDIWQYVYLELILEKERKKRKERGESTLRKLICQETPSTCKVR